MHHKTLFVLVCPVVCPFPSSDPNVSPDPQESVFPHPHRTKTEGYRRNRSFLYSTMTSWVILPLASLLALFLAGSPARAQTGTCPPVSNISVHAGFDFERFANGTRWNVIQYNKIIPIEGLDMEVVKSDVSLLFSRDPNNTMTVNLGELSATWIELYKPFIFLTSDGLDIMLALEYILL